MTQASTLVHSRHLERRPVWHDDDGKPVEMSEKERHPHLYCLDSGHVLIGYGTEGGLLCGSLHGRKDLPKPCHGSCVIECGESNA